MKADLKALNLIERLGRLISTDAHAAGLQPVQWAALRYLGQANRFSKTAAAVTLYLGFTKGTVSQTLMALEAKGLIKKQVDLQDRRSNRILLTTKGKNYLRKDPLTLSLEALHKLPGKSRTELTQTLEALLIARLDGQERRAFGECRSCIHFSAQHAEGKPHYCLLLETGLSEPDANAICVEQQPGASH